MAGAFVGLVARSLGEVVAHLLLGTFLLFFIDFWLGVYIHCN